MRWALGQKTSEKYLSMSGIRLLRWCYYAETREAEPVKDICLQTLNLDYLHMCMFVSRRVSCDTAIQYLLDSFLQERPLGNDVSKHINLKVMSKEGEEVQFKIE